MAKHKSPGQKRRTVVQIVMAIIFAVSTFAAATMFERLNGSTLAWTATHGTVSATVTELTQEEEEYRNLKGRTRHRDVYYVTYSFVLDGEDYSSTVEVGETLYANLQPEIPIEVWYDPDDPYVSDTRANIEHALNSNDLVGSAIAVVPYTGPASLVGYWLLALIFVRESKKVLPEGFYTETSWLDIDDNFVVALDEGDLVYFGFNAKRADAVQEAYQSGERLDVLIATAGAKEVKRVPLGNVSELTSAHNDDTLRIKHEGKSHSIEFLNQTVKAHALDQIRQFIPGSLCYSKVEKTRVQAALPAVVALAVLGAMMLYFSSFLLQVLIGGVAVLFVVPRGIARLLDPTVTESWLPAPDTEAATG